VEDVLQESMVVVLRVLRNPPPDQRFQPAQGYFRRWLAGVVHNKCREAFRRRSQVRGSAGAASLDESTASDHTSRWGHQLMAKDPFAELIRNLSLRDAIQLAWPKLDAREKAVMSGILDSSTPQTIAKGLNLSVENYYVIKHRVLSQIRLLLADD
jgi:RNA polymerase sigma factor (sigma-70 family)